jgi:hypothetical protein
VVGCFESVEKASEREKMWGLFLTKIFFRRSFFKKFFYG